MMTDIASFLILTSAVYFKVLLIMFTNFNTPFASAE